MSGTSSSTTCPVCGSENLQTYTDWKPFDTTSGECLDCGFNYHTIIGERMDIETINEIRQDSYELPPLTQEEYDQHNQAIKDFNSF